MLCIVWACIQEIEVGSTHRRTPCSTWVSGLPGRDSSKKKLIMGESVLSPQWRTTTQVRRHTQRTTEEKLGGSVVLGKCFPVDAQVSCGMLSHNHLLLVLLCWQMIAVWNLSKEECRICGVHDDGRLDLELVVGVKNLTENDQMLPGRFMGGGFVLEDRYG